MQTTFHAPPVLKTLCLTLAAAGLIGAALPARAQAVTDANNNNRFGLDAGTNVTGDNNTGIGTNTGSSVNGSTNTAVGLNSGSNVTGNSNNSLGVQAGGNVKGSGNSAVGNEAGSNVIGNANLSLGDQAGSNVTGEGNMATGVGAGNGVNGDNNNAVGIQAGRNVTGSNNNAMGSAAGANVQGNENFSAGSLANIGTVGSRNVAIGVLAGTAGSTQANPIDDGIALGSFSSVSVSGAVALGANSVAGAGNAGWNGVVVNGQAMTNNAAHTTGMGVVSVGGNGIYRQITNVADGAVDAASTDAVNGSQLFKTIQSVAGSGIQYDTPAKDSLTLGGAGGTVIKNLRAGVVAAGSLEAVNGDQLNTTNQAVAANSAGITSLTQKTDTTNQAVNANTNSINTLNQRAASTDQAVAANTGSINNLTQQVTNGTIGLTQQAGGVSTGSLSVGAATGGAVVNFAGTSGSRTLSGVAAGVASTDAVNMGQLAAVTSSVANAVQYDDATKANLTLGGANGTRIGNVKAGAVTATSMEAVNGSQLNAVKAVADNSVQYAAGGNAVQLNSNGGAGTLIDNVAAGTVARGSQQAVNGGQLNVVKERADNSVQYGANGASVQLNANAGAGTAIDNVAEGSVAQSSHQAVNGGQLYQTNQSVAAVSQSVSGVTARVNALDQTVQDNQREARRGIAAAMAMSAAPMPSAPGKTAWAFNAANFKGQSALAASISHRIKSTNALAVNAGVTASSGAMGVRIGVSGEF